MRDALLNRKNRAINPKAGNRKDTLEDIAEQLATGTDRNCPACTSGFTAVIHADNGASKLYCKTCGEMS